MYHLVHVDPGEQEMGRQIVRNMMQHIRHFAQGDLAGSCQMMTVSQ